MSFFEFCQRKIVVGRARSSGVGNSGNDRRRCPHFSEDEKPQLPRSRPTGGNGEWEITVQILETFSDYDDYQAWLPTTVSRGLARKAKSSTWGLYLADAKNQAEDLKHKREAAEKRERDWEIERERQKAADAVAVAELDQPMPAPQAYSRIQSHMEGRGVPLPLKARLERARELISPNELARQISVWKRCPDCRDEGTLGSAIDRDLRFCGCPAGIETSYRGGADWAEREIARVHADAKSTLVAACPRTRTRPYRRCYRGLRSH